jgi:hypothetical protein
LRGLATAAALIVIALACVVVSRKLEHERRLLRKLRTRSAAEAHRGLSLDELSDGERDAAVSLAASGILVIRQNRCHVRTDEVATFHRKRFRLVLSGALGALLLACLVAVLILHR